MIEHSGMRLLPWAGLEGKPCYLSEDSPGGYVSRLADNMEAVQLGMAGQLLDHTAELIADQRATNDQLRFALARMSEALTDVKRIADSRCARLPAPDSDPDALDWETDGDDESPAPPAGACA